MFHLIRLAFLYLVCGAGILFVQLNNTPCRAPVVLDDGARPPLGPPIDLSRIGADRDYAMRAGKAVVFWLPRLVDLVGIRGMPFPDYLFGTVCRAEETAPAPAAPQAGGPAPYVAPQVVPHLAPLPREPAPPVPRPRG